MSDKTSLTVRLCVFLTLLATVTACEINDKLDYERASSNPTVQKRLQKVRDKLDTLQIPEYVRMAFLKRLYLEYARSEMHKKDGEPCKYWKNEPYYYPTNNSSVYHFEVWPDCSLFFLKTVK